MPLSHVLEHPSVYWWWQRPFRRQKIDPFLCHNDLSEVTRVLEIGCGPGTNAGLFGHTEYLGIDISHDYVSAARRRFGERFLQADATQILPLEGKEFKTVFMNSLLHHLSDTHVRTILRQLAAVLPDSGRIHVMDLVFPARRGIARWLARHDRGHFARPLAAWRKLFADAFHIELFEPYSVSVLGIALWEMVYFKGRPRHD